jgi:hypothetical protein
MRFAIALILLAAPSFVMGQANDFLLVPGVRVGPLTASAVKADVPRLFPGATVKDDELELDEGYVLQATFVNREKRPESLAIVWNGKTPDSHPKQVFVCRGRGRGECKWHAVAPGGNIGVGVKMLDLEKINGKPFTIHGFGYGYGGNIESWDGGKIEKFDCNNSLLLGVDGVRNREGEFTVNVTSEEKQSFSGNRSIPTTNEGLRKLNPAITDIVFNFAEPGAKSCGN